MSEISSTAASATIAYTASQKTQIASAQSTSDPIDAIEQTVEKDSSGMLGDSDVGAWTDFSLLA